ncbi:MULTISPECIES: DUF3047 domain-containing protein [unclassified Cupriavidus]|uniref:DUF3047 domain-containing protein n=1 Tax=unclassified Cupriavidus TaxID=2640874 RepID=UPI0010F8BB2E|nr:MULTISPECIES: DUF3047 domain-containing protein [unclassified Cupriavidus]MWL88535.1 DUF3047 domain-containing protein [Cupriavidus sp. SW-Y-13]
MAKEFRPALACVAGIVLLAGCASSALPPVDPSKMADISDGSCKTFAVKAVPITASAAATPDPLALANRSAPSDVDAEAGADGEAEADAELAQPLAQLPPFSLLASSGQMQSTGWQPWRVNRNKTPTRYSLTELDQHTVLHAQADASASGLYVPLTEREARTLRWRWKTRDVIRVADNAVSHREDAPLRIFVAFDGDRSSLPLRDQLMYEMARITTGREMPYATLMYIWGGRRPEGSILNNPHTDRVRMIVVDSGTRHTNEWRCHERDLRADYRKAFGSDPGKILAVGLMTDTDNTKSRAESWYGDIAID